MSATTHHSNQLFVAARLSAETIAIYPICSKGDKVQCVACTSVRKKGTNVRTWTSKFLNGRRLAVGLGRSTEPILVHDFSREGVIDFEQGRALSFDQDDTENSLDFAGTAPRGTSVYSIAPLSPSSTSGGAEGDLFLSGAYDANVRYASPSIS